ncbi:hypothetical protein LPJ59_006168, partial [Coemansia sp. RSA 2399]
WTNSIAVYPAEWTDTLFVRRELVDASTSTWGNHVLKSNTVDPSTCSMYSTVFGNNEDGMRCNSIQVNSVWNSACPFPYGSLYGEVAGTSLAIGGLHSYTFMPTSDYCNGDRGLYYFTMLYNYIEWGESVIGRSISTLVADTSAYDATSKSTSFSMNDSNDFNPKNCDSGDIHTGKATNGSNEYDGLVSDDANSVGAISNGKSYDGLTQGAIVAIAVSVPLGVIILAIVAFFIYKRRHSWEGRVAHGWGKSGIKNQNAVNDLVGEIGGATEHDNLPSYDELHESPRDNNGAIRESSLSSTNPTTFEKRG